MTNPEARLIIVPKTHAYQPKFERVKAVQFDGTFDMAKAVDELCTKSYVTYDEAGQIEDLVALSMGSENVFQKVYRGDYLIWKYDHFEVMNEEDFDEVYERVNNV